jgi:pyruvate dehydrogenase E1 component alpha subunit
MSETPSVEPLPYSAEDLASALGSRWQETLLAAHYWMTLARTLDGRMQGLQRQGRIGFYGAATGQEAVNVATGLATETEDWIFPGLREQLISLVRGYSLLAYAHSLFADDRDVSRGRQMPCHPSAREVHYVSMSSVIGTQISQAAGLAYAIQRRKDPGVVLGFFGDGATSSNDFHAGLNLAGVYHLPIVFVCANNQWAISLPVERQTASVSLAAKAHAYGFEGTRVDGTDFVAVYRALRAALLAARSGKGPALLEFATYRMTPHSSSDDASRYQPKDWASRAQRFDPVLRLTDWMRSHELLTAAIETSVHDRAENEVKVALRQAEETPPPAPESLTEDVYSPYVSRERALPP